MCSDEGPLEAVCASAKQASVASELGTLVGVERLLFGRGAVLVETEDSRWTVTPEGVAIQHERRA